MCRVYSGEAVSGLFLLARHQRLLPRVLPPTYCAKASCAQLPDMPLRRDTQALRFIARIPLIQRRKKCPSREEKSAFT